MSFRDDGDALLARNDALATENERLRAENARLKRDPTPQQALVQVEDTEQTLDRRPAWKRYGFAVVLWVVAIFVAIMQ
ncbi:MAG: hypothetical protein WKG01_37325, partial [Kofleriaceae bacterium]